MFEREIERYNTLLREYKTTVIDKFNVEDLKEYNEILFSAHSCAIEGNTFSVDDTRALKEKGLGMTTLPILPRFAVVCSKGNPAVPFM